MVNIQDNKHKQLIQFPISTELEKVRKLVEGFIKSPTVLLKADTGGYVNLMNLRTFDSIYKDRTVLQRTSLRMEAYGNNSAVEVLGKFHAFLRWKGRVYRQLLYVTDANISPDLLSRDGCCTLGVIKPCCSMESTRNSNKFQAIPEVTPTQPTISPEKAKLHGDSFNHCANEGTEMFKWTDSKKPSIKNDEFQGAPLMKVRVLVVYSDIFTEIGKFP